MDLLVFTRTKNVLTKLEHRRVLASDRLVQDLVEILGSQMLYVALICCQVNGQGKQLDCPDVGVWVEDQFYHVVHAVCVGECIAYSCLGRQKIQYVEGGHSIGRILSEQVYELGDKPSLFD